MNCELTKYPYFIYPAVEALRKSKAGSQPASLSAEETRRLRRLVTANVGHLPSLRLILGEDPEDFAHFYPDMETTTPSTLDTIDSFIDRFGSRKTSPHDYASILDSGASEVSPLDSDANEVRTPEPVFSEEAARERILNRDYNTALDIFNHIILDNPEKSVYFADQIRFLRKLILNENHKTIRLNGQR